MAKDFLVVGEDFWLEREEYDGAEWWAFKTLPVKPEEERRVETIIADTANTLNLLEEIND